MASLTDTQKRFVVTELAQFQSPSEVVDSVKQEFGIDVSRQQVHHYDPTVGRQPAEQWRELFKQTRRTYLQDTSKVAIAHRGFRLRRLMRLHDRAEDMGNLALAAELLEQAAKEAGGAFTNRNVFDVDPKGALAQLLGVDPDELPDDLT